MTGWIGLHASCALVGEAGVLIRGASGSGKSALALALAEAAARRGLHGRLVADDRVLVAARHGRLVARTHPAIAGLVEVRGAGIARVAHAPAAVVRLVVDLVAAPPRLPEALETALEGVVLPLLTLPAGRPSADPVLRRLGANSDGGQRATIVT